MRRGFIYYTMIFFSFLTFPVKFFPVYKKNAETIKSVYKLWKSDLKILVSEIFFWGLDGLLISKGKKS